MPDDYGYVTNDDGDVGFLARHLILGEPIHFSWTDGRGSAYEVTMMPSKAIATWAVTHSVPNGARSQDRVIVGVHRMGCFHVNLMTGLESFSEAYVCQKFGFDPGFTPQAFAELLNKISHRIQSHGRNLIV